MAGVNNFNITDELFTDAGLANLFINIYGEDYLYENNNINYFNGDIWTIVTINTIKKRIYNEFYDLIKNRIDITIRNDYKEWARYLKIVNKIKKYERAMAIVFSIVPLIKRN